MAKVGPCTQCAIGEVLIKHCHGGERYPSKTWCLGSAEVFVFVADYASLIALVQLHGNCEFSVQDACLVAIHHGIDLVDVLDDFGRDWTSSVDLTINFGGEFEDLPVSGSIVIRIRMWNNSNIRNNEI